MRTVDFSAGASGCRRPHGGFTLVELMVTVAIIGVLSAMAYPAYQAYTVKSRRAAAQAHLMDIAQRQQQYFLDARSYAPDLATLNMTTPADVSAAYIITICQTAIGACVAPGGAPPTFAAIARPNAGAQASDGALSINSVGAKTSTNNTW